MYLALALACAPVMDDDANALVITVSVHDYDCIDGEPAWDGEAPEAPEAPVYVVHWRRVDGDGEVLWEALPTPPVLYPGPALDACEGDEGTGGRLVIAR